MEQGQLDFLTQQKIELMLTMKTRKFEEELTALKTQIGTLEMTIAQLRSEMRAAPKSAPQVTPHIRTPEPEKTTEPATPEPAKTESSTSHPRQGKYKSEDVSIEKYFNFSRK